VRPEIETTLPEDAAARKAVTPVICYPVETLPRPDLAAYRAAQEGWALVKRVTVPARDAACFTVPAGHFFRICSVEGPQVGDGSVKNLGQPACRSRVDQPG